MIISPIRSFSVTVSWSHLQVLASLQAPPDLITGPLFSVFSTLNIEVMTVSRSKGTNKNNNYNNFSSRSILVSLDLGNLSPSYVRASLTYSNS